MAHVSICLKIDEKLAVYKTILYKNTIFMDISTWFQVKADKEVKCTRAAVKHMTAKKLEMVSFG